MILLLGHYSEGGTPVPIPNTAVKSFSAYGTSGLPWWESRSWPSFIVTIVKELEELSTTIFTNSQDI